MSKRANQSYLINMGNQQIINQEAQNKALLEDSSYFTKTKNTEDLWGEMTNEELAR